ncbi:probable glutamate receptor [Panulirus ornatus]|uniref:probable glutamate receptor n=1 Tax=Panulirus ornatus TaxID=150431 RepID=UPI003A8696C8
MGQRCMFQPTELADRKRFIWLWVGGMSARAIAQACGTSATTLRQLTRCVTMVVVSNDPAFLAAFSQSSIRSSLLVWPVKLLAVTEIPLVELQYLHETLSMTNSVLLVIKDKSDSLSCRMYIRLPYSPEEAQALRLASWTPHQGLTLTTHLPLFPDKFSKFVSAPTLVVAVEVMPYHYVSVLERDESLRGEWITFTGVMANLVDYMSTSMNFSQKYIRSFDKSFGSKQEDGSWSGMIGLVMKKVADFATGPFIMSPARGEVVDFCWPVWTDDVRILGARGRPEVDPWGFLLPLTPLVWVAILTALLVVPMILFLISYYVQLYAQKIRWWFMNIFDFTRILLQQDILLTMDWWWYRLVLGMWMMMTLVLTRSYAGNLMSLLAVRHIPQPYQTLRDVLGDPSVIMIWQKHSRNEQYLRTVKSGIFREVADLESEGRVTFHTQAQFRESIDTLVRRGDHILVDVGVTQRNLIVQDFSRTGRCDFYMSKDGFLPFYSTLIVQKNSPLLRAMSKRSLAVVESGIFRYWFLGAKPNSSYCRYPPKKMTVMTSLSVANLWGMFIVLVCGHFSGVLILGFEVILAPNVYFRSSGSKSQ